MVYVISKDGKPLMPCENAVARLLLKNGKAKCIKRTPFTIKLKYKSGEYTQDLTLGIDTGSGKIGSAVVNEKNEVVYSSETEIRNDIRSGMKQRKMFRQNRRARKTRYRKPRFLNRKNSIKKGRFSPTMRSKHDAHVKEVKFVESILPVTKIIAETGTFDPHLMKNPKLHNEKYRKWGYQQGPNYGFANTKAYVLNRDGYKCQKCGCKKKGEKLEVHHIVYRSNGGSDEAGNLITLCSSCHRKVHEGKIKVKNSGKSKGNLNHATQMNSIRIQFLKSVECEETFGYVTKENRMNLGLPKAHYIDAAVIATGGNRPVFRHNSLLLKKCVSEGDYKQTMGKRSEIVLSTGKLCGLRKFDKVLYRGGVYFIQGKMSKGNYGILMDIHGDKVTFDKTAEFGKTPKLIDMKRISARDSWIMFQKTIQNIC